MLKIKWNWGTGLFIAASLFILLMIGFVYFMFRENYDLVEKDYYPKALVYQQRIDKLNNTAQLKQKAKVEVKGYSVMITFPPELLPESISGSVVFYRPSGVSGDVNATIKVDSSGVMIYPLTGLKNGNYVVKLDYNFNDRGYYQEEALFVP
jgi:hypothetical protein